VLLRIERTARLGQPFFRGGSNHGTSCNLERIAERIARFAGREGLHRHAPENGQLRLNQLHAACHGRIQYEKTCPLHGSAATDQIVMGYQYAQDQYVVVDLAELDQLRSEEEKRAIRIDTFTRPEFALFELVSGDAPGLERLRLFVYCLYHCKLFRCHEV